LEVKRGKEKRKEMTLYNKKFKIRVVRYGETGSFVIQYKNPGLFKSWKNLTRMFVTVGGVCDPTFPCISSDFYYLVRTAKQLDSPGKIMVYLEEEKKKVKDFVKSKQVKKEEKDFYWESE
jgi:hypothetical protein